jgi:hypothetical protein
MVEKGLCILYISDNVNYQFSVPQYKTGIFCNIIIKYSDGSIITLAIIWYPREGSSSGENIV